jgi:putative PD-(D/E)XK family protein DUF4420
MCSRPPLRRSDVTTKADPSRHVPVGVIEDYVNSGLDGVIGYAGAPQGRLIISPQHRMLAVQFPAGARAPQVVEYENLTFQALSEEDGTWHRVSVGLDENLDEVYAFLCAILDRVQLAGEPFADAVDAALDSLTGILAVRQRLTQERQLGLFGELLTLLALVEKVGQGAAVGSWRGPLKEEHDFGLAQADFEVKTTLSEKREHWISAPTQLTPTGERPLYVVSVQLTTAAVDQGHTLPSLVSLVRSKLPNGLADLNAVLTRLAYRDRDADLYHSRWTLRTTPAFYEVDARFPAVTQKALEAAVPAAERVRELRYRIDLTGMPASPPLFEFGQL